MPGVVWDSVDLDKPYIGWFNHHLQGWQVAIVRVKEGRRFALRLGSEVDLRNAMFIAQTLSEIVGVPVAGELAKGDGFLPVSMGGLR
jgi:hypothetical protein